jgi:hypothetical protein
MNQLLKKQLRLMTTFFIFFLFWNSCYGQARHQNGLLHSVPETWRSRLLERFNSFLEDHRAQQWDKLYELMDYDFNVGSREDFVRSRNQDSRAEEVLLDFVPQRVSYRQSKEWAIEGCSKWQKLGELSATVYAYRHDEDWYFSPIAFEMVTEKTQYGWRSEPNSVIPCKAKTSS